MCVIRLIPHIHVLPQLCHKKRALPHKKISDSFAQENTHPIVLKSSEKPEKKIEHQSRSGRKTPKKPTESLPSIKQRNTS